MILEATDGLQHIYNNGALADDSSLYMSASVGWKLTIIISTSHQNYNIGPKTTTNYQNKDFILIKAGLGISSETR